MPGGGTRPGEEVRDGPHSDNRCGGNRGGVAPTAASLRPRVGPGLSGSGLYNASIGGRVILSPFYLDAAIAMRPQSVARDLGRCEHDYPRWGGHIPFFTTPCSAHRLLSHTAGARPDPGLYNALGGALSYPFRAAFVLPRPREGGFLMYTRRLRARHLLHKKHNTRRYGHRLAGAPGPSGRGCADFHVGVNFRFTQFSEVHIDNPEYIALREPRGSLLRACARPLWYGRPPCN